MTFTEDEKEVLCQFGQSLRSAREAGGWGIEDLAEAVGLDESLLRAVELGEDQFCLLSMNRVAVVLDVDLLAFLPYRGGGFHGGAPVKT